MKPLEETKYQKVRFNPLEPMVSPVGKCSCPSQDLVRVSITANSQNLKAVRSPLHL